MVQPFTHNFIVLLHSQSLHHRVVDWIFYCCCFLYFAAAAAFILLLLLCDCVPLGCDSCSKAFRHTVHPLLSVSSSLAVALSIIVDEFFGDRVQISANLHLVGIGGVRSPIKNTVKYIVCITLQSLVQKVRAHNIRKQVHGYTVEYIIRTIAK